MEKPLLIFQHMTLQFLSPTTYRLRHPLSSLSCVALALGVKVTKNAKQTGEALFMGISVRLFPEICE